MTANLIALWASACLLACASTIAPAQPAPPPAVDLNAAQSAAARGDFVAAEQAYDRILTLRPADTDAQVGRGSARAFQKKYAAAAEDFTAALARQPDRLDARVGLGHALSWSGRHDEAMQQFERALAIAPDSVDAQRGAAYTELWRGNAAAAAQRFERLLAQVPDDRGAQQGREQARVALAGPGPRYEASAWFGRTDLPGGGSETGLRYAELAVWPNDRLRLFARYDDGLSRDNAALVRLDQSATLKSVGGYLRWHERYGTLVEVGRRNFPDDVHQNVYRVEQSFYLDRGYEIKAGGWRGPRSDDRTEWQAYAGAAVPLAEGWRLEPTYFYSRDGSPGAHEWRLLLATHYDLRNGWELGAGVAGGRARAAGIDRDVRDGFLRASYRVSPWLQLHALARRETVEGADSITVVSIGTTLTWR